MTDHPEKPTEQWVTGDEPMTGPQRSYLETLAREAGEEVSMQLTKAQASEEIERLQHVTGRGGEHVERHEADRTDDDRVNRETLAERVDQAGVVDQQSVIVSDQESG